MKASNIHYDYYSSVFGNQPYGVDVHFSIPSSFMDSFCEPEFNNRLEKFLEEYETLENKPIAKKVKPTKFQIGLLALNLAAITLSIISLVKRWEYEKK